jgi:hypothetical protein
VGFSAGRRPISVEWLRPTEFTPRDLASAQNREDKLLDLLTNSQLASLEDAIIIAKIMNKVVNQMDVQLAQALSQAPDELAARILRLLAEISDSNRTLPLLTSTLRGESPELRSKAAFVFARHCHNSLFIERALQDNDAKVRASALKGLSLSGHAVDPSALSWRSLTAT